MPAVGMKSDGRKMPSHCLAIEREVVVLHRLRTPQQSSSAGGVGGERAAGEGALSVV